MEADYIEMLLDGAYRAAINDTNFSTYAPNALVVVRRKRDLIHTKNDLLQSKRDLVQSKRDLLHNGCSSPHYSGFAWKIWSEETYCTSKETYYISKDTC